MEQKRIISMLGKLWNIKRNVENLMAQMDYGCKILNNLFIASFIFNLTPNTSIQFLNSIIFSNKLSFLYIFFLVLTTRLEFCKIEWV